MMKACFMGLGYIGLPTAIIAAKHGVQVTGVDINPKVVELTNQGKLHIIEPGLEEMLQEVVATGNLVARTTPVESDAYFMVVPTPFKGNHEPDISYVEAATRAVLPLLKEGDLYLILGGPLLLLPPIPPSIRVFSNESTLRMRWPKYWSFSFSITPSKEIPGLISFKMDWLDLLLVQGTLKSLLQHHNSKASIFWHSAFVMVQLSHPYMTTEKPQL